MKVAAQLEKLHSVLKPLMLRRMKEDVEKSLKPKEETVINVEMTAMQAEGGDGDQRGDDGDAEEVLPRGVRPQHERVVRSVGRG